MSLTSLVESGQVCGICHEDMRDPESHPSTGIEFGVLDLCEHVYHLQCISRWCGGDSPNDTCPTCRVKVKEITVVDGDLLELRRCKVSRPRRSNSAESADPYPDEEDVPDHMKYHCDICGDGEEEDVQLVGCCGMDNTCDSVFHLSCLGYRRIPQRWE